MGKSSVLPRHRLTCFSLSLCCRVGSVSRTKLPDFSFPRCEAAAPPPGRVGARGTHAGSANGRVPSAGWGRPRGRTAARLSGTSLPSLPSSILPARAGARAPRSLPRGLASAAPSRFLSPAAAGLEARVEPPERPLHPTSLPGRPFPTVGTAHPKARRCEHVVCGGDFTTCTGIIFVGGERTVS